MKLSLLITAHCNARCAHCSTGCGPERQADSLDTEHILRLMSEAAALRGTEPLQFGFSGGEAFLDLPRLLRLLHHGQALGAGMISCVSNAAWASSEAKAEKIIRAVKTAGLTLLSVSSSSFHEQFIPRSRVERALRLANAQGLDTCVKYVQRTDDPRSAEDVRRWAGACGTEDVEILPLMWPVRDDAALPDAAFARQPGLPGGACPAPVLTVLETGQAYPCCTPGVNVPFHALGNTHDLPLQRILDRYQLRGTQQILRRDGPIAFARAIQAAGLGQRLRERYGSVCELCTHIAGDDILAAIARRCGEQHEHAQINQLFAGLRQLRSANTSS